MVSNRVLFHDTISTRPSDEWKLHRGEPHRRQQPGRYDRRHRWSPELSSFEEVDPWVRGAFQRSLVELLQVPGSPAPEPAEADQPVQSDRGPSARAPHTP